MFTNNKIAQGVRFAIFAGFTAASLSSPIVFAADEESVERIQVTGSSIKRTDMEGALPIVSISKEDIAKSGVTSVPDLVAQLPAMQGFTTASDSVGGGGGGVQSASLRDLGDQYTLVLLNGRRMAPSGSGSTIDLNSIPLPAIERVEVLMDGASALYGSDAIAGVVNFIMKQDFQGVTLSARIDRPQESGGESENFSISAGLGDLSQDGYNLMAAYSHDSQGRLRSSQRDFSNTGILGFSHNDNDYTLVQGSANAGPGNAYLRFKQFDDAGNVIFTPKLDDDGNEIPGEFTDTPDYYTRNFNPFREANAGVCGPDSASSGSTCVFDYTSTLEILPETKRDNIFVQGLFELSDEMQAYANYSWSKFEMVTRIAPYPTGGFVLPLDSSLVASEVLPHLNDDENAKIAAGDLELDQVVARWRTLPGGNRTTAWDTTTNHAVAGLRGEVSEITFDVAITMSDAEREQNRLTGYPIEDPFMALVTSGEVNVFGTFEALSDEANMAIKDTMYNGPWDKTDTSMASIEGSASTVIGEVEAGEIYLGAGFDYREVEFTRRRSQANADAIILFEAPTDEFDMSRETYGMFLELIAPVTDEIEVTAAIRYDNIGAVTDHDRAENKVVNKDVNDTTYKVSGTYRPTDEWLIRASIGTGFKAATMRQIASPREDFGVTSGSFDCPTGLKPELAALCFPEPFQYQVWLEGNANLKPETSEQFSTGVVYAPDNDFSLSIDYWSVDLEDQVTRLTEAQLFGDAVKYAEFFTTKPNLGTGGDDLAIIQAAVNIGKSKNSGLDWALNVTNEFSFGELKTSFTGTYMIESESLRAGTTDVWDTSLGKFGSNDAVTFRTITRLSNTLTHGDFAHTVNFSYRSGYQDQLATGGDVRLASDIDTDAPDIQLTVPSYTKIDYVGKYFVTEMFNVTLGINNLMDKQPPLSLRTSGAGHQVGYDPRYTDSLGRTFYLAAEYSF
ncbi:TonB-dependent receptor domain-containing protein [Psychrobium sp. 1_MG-2023]|uniref:TonB-dependent receptor domain-containing protein n=1 Tax=Psychrobium sp. 1_MG-2023 TaxID=3062624 RepID=UPI000C340C6E|nr:TonB-dependent receptor [Psychrobium sp. 1_MG-2023]MDP2560972.1 TonB-dependent receptor [Psychrobium sp. 1_MG-2023]PKF54949.1 TonB-dependent receptor [Alteromonadales bacterium alter-6D02]